MSANHYLFTSESVSEGHPDKICDRASDAIVDEFLRNDDRAHVAVETLVTTNLLVLAGEFASTSDVKVERLEEIVREVVRDIGYEQDGFHWQNFDFKCYIHGQSRDIAQGVDGLDGREEGAGDQGIMFGYACRETEELMPAPICFAHKILQNLSQFRRQDSQKRLGPDAKSQVTLAYDHTGMPLRATGVVVSTQHSPDISQRQVKEIVEQVVASTLPDGWMCPRDRLYVNPTGKFVIGGPDGDAGLTGRKIIVDTYGGAAPHGGGAFSGKDPTKVDRSAAYMARYLAKNIVAAGLAKRCTIQIAYAIGIAKPLAFYLNFHGTGKVGEQELASALQEAVDLTPSGIRRRLQLQRPIYERSANYGHFGRKPDADGGFSWEKLDMVETIRALLS